MTWKWHWRQDDYVIKIKLKNNNKTDATTTATTTNYYYYLLRTQPTNFQMKINIPKSVRLSRWECRFTYDELMKFTMISFNGFGQSPRIHFVNNIIVESNADAEPSRAWEKSFTNTQKSAHTQHHVRMEIRTPTPLNSIRLKWSFYNRYKLHCNAVR